MTLTRTVLRHLLAAAIAAGVYGGVCCNTLSPVPTATSRSNPVVTTTQNQTNQDKVDVIVGPFSPPASSQPTSP